MSRAVLYQEFRIINEFTYILKLVAKYAIFSAFWASMHKLFNKAKFSCNITSMFIQTFSSMCWETLLVIVFRTQWTTTGQIAGKLS